MKTVYQIGIIFLWIFVASGNCPVEDNITPCKCITIKDGISVECKGPEDSGRIISTLNNLINFQNLELILETVTLPILPSSVREVTTLSLHNVHIEKKQNNSSFVWSKLSDVIIESSTISDDPWPNFQEAPLLKHYEISKIQIPTIGSEFRESMPTSLTYLDIRKTGTIAIKPHALGHLKKLKYFIMVDIPLQEFSRDVLPSHMPDLHTFILGNTQIEKLEPHFFEGMPKLEIIMLNGNKFTTLDFNVFGPIENQLTHLLAERNPLICDCNLLWLTDDMEKKRSMKVLATCNDNVTQERKEVTELDENEYCF